MITDILIHIGSFITQTINTLGYFGVTLLMAIESAAIPLPSEIIMPFAGFLVESGRFSLVGLAIAGAVGSTIGSLITYYLGYYGGRKLALKYENIFLVTQADLDVTERFFNRFQMSATLLGRIIPVIRTFISIPAGIARVPIVPFAIYAFVGSFIWSYFLAWLGFKLGENWQGIEVYFRKFDLVIGIFILLVLAYWVNRRRKK